jgi:hypothetical protein
MNIVYYLVNLFLTELWVNNSIQRQLCVYSKFAKTNILWISARFKLLEKEFINMERVKAMYCCIAFVVTAMIS